MAKRAKILITIKTYPLPSKSHMELVCTGGVQEDGSFIRLYPIDYRYRPYWEWYKKYQWIEVEIEKNPRDPRPESFRPVSDAQIKVVGEPLSSKNNWRERKKYVLAKEIPTMCWLEKQKQEDFSLGIIRVRKAIGFIAELTERDWKPKWENLFNQLNLFGPKRKPLEKIPYKFTYHFLCDEPKCKGHKKMIEDWEICELYRKMRIKHGSEKVALEKVKDTFLDRIFASNRDTHFFVGTVLRYGSWVVLGTFWPEKELSKS